MDPNLQIRQAEQVDLPGIAQVHIAAFPEYFQTHLGADFLIRFYRNYFELPGYCYVATYQNRPIGFVVGSMSNPILFRRFYRQNFFFLAFTLIKKFLSDRVIRASIMKRLFHVKAALLALFPSNKANHSQNKASKDKNTDVIYCRLVGIGVHPDYRRRGVAEALTDTLLKTMTQNGCESVRLGVLKDNEGARSFYEKSGWKLVAEGTDSFTYQKDLK